MRKSKVYIVLLHYPMYNKRMDTVTTSITNLDLHDIARAGRTYDVDGFYVVHPAENQHKLMREIAGYWQEGYGGEYNADRKEAFSRLRTAYTLEEVITDIRKRDKSEIITVATDARVYPNTVSYRHLKDLIVAQPNSFLILFGTGWGMHQDIVQSCDYILEPVEGNCDYNHLSVRSAVSIILDRLLGECWYV